MKILIAVSGLPGTGKSTLSLRLAARLQLTLLELDRLEAPLLRQGITGDQIAWGGYEMLTALADLNLGMGLGVVLDSVAWTNAIRERWAALAESHGAPFLPIEMTCTDSAGRLDRLRTRWPSLSTAQLEERIGQEHARYEAWEMPSLTLDSTISLDELLDLALAAAATADRR